MNHLKPRSIIAYMLYGTFCVMCIKGMIKPDAMVAAVGTLAGFYYGSKNGKETPKQV